MSSAARSIFAYSIYLFGLGGTLLLAPNVPLPIFGLPPATEVWVRVVGMTVVFFAIYYLVAARNEFRPFFVVSVPVRLSVPFVFGGLIAAGFASWHLLLFTPFDVAFGAWTWFGLRSSAATA